MLSFTELRRDHFPLLHRWFALPHMTYWTRGETFSLEAIEAQYAGHLTSPIRSYLIELNGRAVGYIQWYPMAESYPEGVNGDEHRMFAQVPREQMAGLDMFIGEQQLLGTGVAIEALEAFVQQYVFAEYSAIVLDPLKSNARAIRAFEKTGFVRTDFSDDPAYVLLLRRR